MSQTPTTPDPEQPQVPDQEEAPDDEGQTDGTK